MDRQHLIKAIEDHARRRGIAPATVTSRAVANSRLYARLKAGGDCTTSVAGRIVQFIKDDSPEDQKGAA